MKAVLDVYEAKLAIQLYLKQEYQLEVSTDDIQPTHAGSYEDREFAGFEFPQPKRDN